MGKPTLHATWDSNSTNCIVPLTGHISDGFVNNEIPTAGEFNEWMRRVGIHCDYLITGDLEIDGLTTAEVDLAMPNAAAVLTPATYATVIRLTGGGASAKIQGIQPDVDGRTLVLVNGTGADVTLSIQDGATLYQLWVGDAAAGAQLRLAPNAAVGLRWNGIDGQWIALFSTAPLTPATRTIPIDISKAQICGIGTGTLTLSGSVRYLVSTSGPTLWDFPVELPVGSIITEVVVGYNREASASVAFELDRWSLAGSETVVTSHVDTTSSGDTTASYTSFGAGLPFTTLANETLSLLVSASTNARIYSALVTFKPPV